MASTKRGLACSKRSTTGLSWRPTPSIRMMLFATVTKLVSNFTRWSHASEIRREKASPRLTWPSAKPPDTKLSMSDPTPSTNLSGSMTRLLSPGVRSSIRWPAREPFRVAMAWKTSTKLLRSCRERLMASPASKITSSTSCRPERGSFSKRKWMFPGWRSPWMKLSANNIFINMSMQTLATRSRTSSATIPSGTPGTLDAASSSNLPCLPICPRTACRGTAFSYDSTNTASSTKGLTTSGKRTRRPLPVSLNAKFFRNLSMLSASMRRSACGRTKDSKWLKASDIPRYCAPRQMASTK
mmetsp:Transcript_31437/g.90785  ORF Transcript_31437/g.90785 Transcript_31437/m.90785 type:complete len:298 (-) Transcript_31437:941-1834(-)